MRDNQSPATALPHPTTTAAPRRYLLAELNRWARANGWKRCLLGGRGRTQLWYRVAFNDHSVSVWHRNRVTHRWAALPVTYNVTSVEQAIGHLRAAGVLPMDVFGAAGPAGIAVAA